MLFGGRVIDRITEAPVKARVKHGGAFTWTSAQDGSFSIRGIQGDGPIIVTADGYIDSSIDPPGPEGLPITIRLAAALKSTGVMVDESGAPEAGVSIYRISKSPGNYPLDLESWATEVTVSGDDGRFTLPVSEAVTYFAGKDARTSQPFSVSKSREESPLHVMIHSSESSKLSVRDADGADHGPWVLNLQFIGQCQIARLQLSLTEDSPLDCALPVGDYVAVSADHAIKFQSNVSKQINSSAARSLGYSSYSSRLRIKPDNSLIKLEVVAQLAPIIHVTDANGADLAPFEIWGEVVATAEAISSGSPPWRKNNHLRRIISPTPRMSLKRFLTRRLENGSGRIAVASPGYRTGYVSNISRTARGPLELALEIDEIALSVLVQASDGEVATGRFQLRFSSNREICYDGLITHEVQTLGPFSGKGERNFTLWQFFNGEFAEVTSVTFEEGETMASVRLNPAGSVAVVAPGLRPDDFVLFDPLGRRFHPETSDDGLLFAEVPIGQYALIGRLQQMAFSSQRADVDLGLGGISKGELYNTNVEVGATTEITLGEPSLPRDYSGRISLDGIAAEELYLYPLYSGEALPRRVAPGAGLMHVSGKGTYNVSRLTPKPAYLVVCRIDDLGLLVPLCMAAPGDDLVGAGGPVSIKTKHDSWYCAHAIYQVGGLTRSATGCSDANGYCNLGWLPAGPLTIECTERAGRSGAHSVTVQPAKGLTLEFSVSEMYGQRPKSSEDESSIGR
jgi:hypothetical protein